MVGQLVLFFKLFRFERTMLLSPTQFCPLERVPSLLAQDSTPRTGVCFLPRNPISFSFCEVFWGRGADDTWPWNGTPVFQAIQSLWRTCPMFSCLVGPVKTISTYCVSKMQQSLSWSSSKGTTVVGRRNKRIKVK